MSLKCKGSEGVTYTGTADDSYHFEIYIVYHIIAVEGKNEGVFFVDSTCTINEIKYTIILSFYKFKNRISSIKAYSFYNSL